jgi:hypothetical protein
MLKSYKIFEGKQLGNLYHIVDFEKLEFILKNNMLKSKSWGIISTTRDKQMWSYVGDNPLSVIKLELDGDKLSNNYKIRPTRFKTTYVGVGGETTPGYLDESEEEIKTNKIPNIGKYIKKIIISKFKIERLKDSSWFSSDGGNFKGERITISELFKRFIENCDYPIYVQYKNKIYKDDEWINSIINHPIKQINHGYIKYKKTLQPHPRDKYAKTEVFEPLDDMNNNLKEVVVGYKYNDLYLFKKLSYDRSKEFRDDIRLFDFIYDNKDIIEETDEFIKVKTAKLDWLKF